MPELVNTAFEGGTNPADRHSCSAATMISVAPYTLSLNADSISSARVASPFAPVLLRRNKWHDFKSKLFKKQPYYLPECDTSLSFRNGFTSITVAHCDVVGRGIHAINKVADGQHIPVPLERRR